jgi:hypothetical protein
MFLFLDDDHRTRIKELGFEDAENQEEVKLHKNLLNCIFQYYDPKEERAIFGSGESFSICLYDVDIILGLNDKATLVQLDEHRTRIKELGFVGC